MTTTGLSTFDRTLQTTNIWLSDIMNVLGPDRQLAWHALGAVLRATRDRLSVEPAAHLAAQLPLLVPGTFYDQFVPTRLTSSGRSQTAFLDQIGKELSASRPVDVKEATRTVFRALNHYLDPGEAEKARQELPAGIRELWPIRVPANRNKYVLARQSAFVDISQSGYQCGSEVCGYACRWHGRPHWRSRPPFRRCRVRQAP